MSESKGSPDPASEPGNEPKRGAAAEEGGEPTGSKGASSSSTPVTQQIGRVVVLVLLVLFIVFALDNAQHVDFSWVFGETQVSEDVAGATSGGVPLIVLLLASFAIGAAVGALLAWQSGRSRRRATGGGKDAGEDTGRGRSET